MQPIYTVALKAVKERPITLAAYIVVAVKRCCWLKLLARRAENFFKFPAAYFACPTYMRGWVYPAAAFTCPRIHMSAQG